MRLRLLAAAFVALVTLPSVAHAGLLNKNIDFFFVDGTVGAEFEHMGLVNDPGRPTFTNSSDNWGVTYGVQAGFRLRHLSIALIYQRTDMLSGLHLNDLNLDKVYGQIGLNLRLGIMMVILHADVGWAGAEFGGELLNGVGAKGGVAFDFYPVRILSLGPAVDFDVQGYATPSNGFISSVGATMQFRVGLHI